VQPVYANIAKNHVLQALWQNQFYYLFGFLFLVFCILVVSCAQIAIVATYFQLCGEVNTVYVNACFNPFVQNYHWWWRSFAVGGSCALYGV
jgi:transmembrane 9 superfamily protein 2/4